MFYVQYLFSKNRAVCEIMWKNTVEPERSHNTIRPMRISCRKTTATNNLILFFTVTMVTRMCLYVTLYIYCLSCYDRYAECLLRGTDRVFNYKMLRFVRTESSVVTGTDRYRYFSPFQFSQYNLTILNTLMAHRLYLNGYGYAHRLVTSY